MAFRRHRLSEDQIRRLHEVLGHAPELLAVAHGPDGSAGIMRRHFVVDWGGWQVIEWMQIQRGGWDDEHSSLYWELADGTKGAIRLTDGAQVPLAFAERVRASIVVQRTLHLSDGSAALIVGRRQPGTDDPITWQVDSLSSADLQDPGIQAEIVAAVEDAKREFE